MSETRTRAVRIADDLWEPLKVEAALIGSDASKVIRELIEEWLEKETRYGK